MRHGIRWHRFTVELDDPKILNKFKTLYTMYRENVRVRKLTNPILHQLEPTRPMNLSQFALMIIQSGIDLTEFRLTRGEPK